MTYTVDQKSLWTLCIYTSDNGVYIRRDTIPPVAVDVGVVAIGGMAKVAIDVISAAATAYGAAVLFGGVARAAVNVVFISSGATAVVAVVIGSKTKAAINVVVVVTSVLIVSVTIVV